MLHMCINLLPEGINAHNAAIGIMNNMSIICRKLACSAYNKCKINNTSIPSLPTSICIRLEIRKTYTMIQQDMAWRLEVKNKVKSIRKIRIILNLYKMNWRD